MTNKNNENIKNEKKKNRELLKNDELNESEEFENVSDEDYVEQIVELINDEGKIEKLVVEATFHLDDIEYAILREENSDEGMIYSVDEMENGEIMFNMIEDEEELKEVIEIYEAMSDDLI